MSAWLLAALGLVLCLAPCGLLCVRGPLMLRLVALEAAGGLVPLVLVCLAQALARPPLYDAGLTAGLLAFGGSLTFVRFIERWL